MRRVLLLVPFLLWALPAFGHPSQGYDTIPNCTIANLNQCGGEKLGNRAWVVDGRSDSDCTVGGGAPGMDAFQHACLKTQFGWRAEKPSCTLDNLSDCGSQVPSGGAIVPQTWQSWVFEPRKFSDIWDLTNDWVQTQTGTCAALQLKTTGYPYMRIQTSALDNDRCEYNFSNTGFPGGLIHQLSRDFYFEALFRVRETTNDANTVTQSEWFLGVGMVGDTTTLDGSQDFLGIYHADHEDQTGDQVFVVSGNFGTTLTSEMAQPTGWITTNPGVGDGNVEANRAAKILGPGNWVLVQMYLHNLTGVGPSASGILDVYIDGAPAVGSPYTVTNNVPDWTSMTPVIAIRNGEASSRILDIARLVYARKMSISSGQLSRYTND